MCRTIQYNRGGRMFQIGLECRKPQEWYWWTQEEPRMPPGSWQSTHVDPEPTKPCGPFESEGEAKKAAEEYLDALVAPEEKQ